MQLFRTLYDNKITKIKMMQMCGITVTLYTKDYGRGIIDLNLGSDSRYTQLKFSWFSSVPPANYRIISRLGHELFP